MEFTKKTLLSILSETHNMEFDEMARRQKNVQNFEVDPETGARIRKYKRDKQGQTVIQKFVPGWSSKNPTQPGQHGVPDYWIVNPEQVPGGESVVVPIGCNELNQFVEENKEWLQEIEAFEGLKPQFLNCKISVDVRPIETAIGYAYQASGEQYDTQNSIKRKFFPILRREFENSDKYPSETAAEFQMVLNKRSIPSISLDVKNEDRHIEKWTNDKLVYRTHNYNSYQSSTDFLNSVISRIAGTETPEMKTHYLARQFNKKYNNWVETKKSDKTYSGKTSIYNLDRLGYEELNLDVSLKMIFEIVGERLDNSFTWSIKMTNKFGKKSPDDYSIKHGMKEFTLKNNGYLDDEVLAVTKTVQLDPTKRYNNKNTIMDDFTIVNGLEEAIHDFKEKIKGINPKSALKIANVKQYDIKEDRIVEIIKSAIQETKKPDKK